MNHNLYAALRAQFSSHLDSTAVETDEDCITAGAI